MEHFVPLSGLWHLVHRRQPWMSQAETRSGVGSGEARISPARVGCSRSRGEIITELTDDHHARRAVSNWNPQHILLAQSWNLQGQRTAVAVTQQQRILISTSACALHAGCAGRRPGYDNQPTLDLRLIHSAKGAAFKAERASWRTVVLLSLVHSKLLTARLTTVVCPTTGRRRTASRQEHLKLKLRLAALLQVDEVLIRSAEQEAMQLPQIMNGPREREWRIDSDAMGWDDPDDPGRIPYACREGCKINLDSSWIVCRGSTYLDIFRQMTLGVSEYRLQVKDAAFGSSTREWRVYDMGGRRSLRAISLTSDFGEHPADGVFSMVWPAPSKIGQVGVIFLFLGHFLTAHPVAPFFQYGDVLEANERERISLEAHAHGSQLFLGGTDTPLYTGFKTAISDFETIIDSGTSLMYGPLDVIARFYAEIPGSGVSYAEERFYYYPCTSNPGLGFNWGGKTWTVSETNFNLGTEALGSKYCAGPLAGMDIGSESMWILGDSFAKNVYTFSFDRKVLVWYKDGVDELPLRYEKQTNHHLCLTLHAILVLIYAVIFAAYLAGVYDKPLSITANTARIVLTVVSQTFTIAYCAILAVLTQRITLHELIQRPQTLTAIHDKSSAWLGLGASLQALARQRKLVTDILGVSMITIYLLLIFVIHTTLPGIFGVTTQSITSFATYPTTLARQIASETPQDLALGPFTSYHYAILQVYHTLTLSTTGLRDNTLYDIIPAVENATGAPVEVNATSFSVSCSLLPDIVQTAFEPGGSEPPSDMPSYVFGFASGKYRVSVWPMRNNAEVINTNPVWLNLQLEFVLNEPAPVMNVTLVACNFDAHNTTINVNSRTQGVVGPVTPPTIDRWQNWVEPGPSLDPLLFYVIQYFASKDPESMAPNVAAISLSNATLNMLTTSRPYGMIEWFLDTDILAGRNTNGSQEATLNSVTVGELETSLARAYAAVLWSYNNMSLQEGSLRLGEVSIPTSALQERLIINKISLIAGLAASCILFAITVAMVVRSGDFASNAATHDVSGLLPILWLLGNEPRLAAMEKPDLDVLRAAGMSIVTRIDKLQRGISGSEDKGGVYASVGYEVDDMDLGLPRSSDRLLAST
ncbi:hypothetical protein NM688_g1559 [Phlebia brevispora]|uniref:Uncharacterized protein n=1 Tax=Phlebia brevispora TaxID=194682 RepID=A0ACC1TB01_9APHY|nr:hypothetical protein NM688_g1559 [Phlebia brevispora]